MEEDRNQEPGERMRNIFSGSGDEANAQFKPELNPMPDQQSKSQSRTPLDRLPRLKPTFQPTPQIDSEKTDSEETIQKPESTATPVGLHKLPQRKQPDPIIAEPEQTTVQQTIIKEKSDMPRREKLLRALWTTTSLISMILNIVLIVVLVILVWAYRDIKLPEGVDISMLNKLLSGLYTNFEKLDRATIQTVIPVDAEIPLDITVPVQRTTQITLSQTVNIPNAQVVINTGGLNINSTARVTLPAGTPLTVDLNFDLPVQTSIPVHLDVPVNIPMTETELHEPFVGLQEVVRPIYCLVEPGAMNLDGQVICR